MEELNDMELAAASGPDENETAEPTQDIPSYEGVGAFVTECMRTSEEFRKEHENLFLRLTYNFNGQYLPQDRSKLDDNDIFLKITRKEVMKAAARINTIINSRQNRAWAIFPTPVPDLGAIGQSIVAQGPQLPAEPSESAMPGAGTMPATPQMPQAQQTGEDPITTSKRTALAAANMVTNYIEDAMVETRYDEKSNRGLIDMCLYGTMVFFGPIHTTRKRRVWSQEQGGMTREELPPHMFDLEYVNLWDFYPEPGAESIEDASWCIVRKMVTKSALRKLKAVEGYIAPAIDEIISADPKQNKKFWENSLENSSESHSTSIGANRYELLDWWGFLNKEDIEEMGLDLEDGSDESEEYIWNIQSVDGKVIYMEASEFHRDRLPFYVTPFERIPRKMFGRGPAEMMEDSQRMINACARAQAKNLSYAAGPLLTVDTSRATGNYTKIIPGKIYSYKNTDATNNTNPFQFITVPSISGEMQGVIGFYKALIQELTSLPEIFNGVNDNSANRTMGQFSMLMGNGDAYLRLVIGNIDTTHTQPIIRSAYEWQMAFNPDKSIKGDMSIEARGVTGVMANELRVSRMTELYREVRQDQTAAVWIKQDKLFHEMIKGLELDAEEFVRTPAEAQEYQQQQLEAQAKQAQMTNVPKLEAEMSDKDALVETMRKVPPEEAAFPILVKKVAETHNFDDPLLDKALATMVTLNTRRAAEQIAMGEHQRAVDAENIRQNETRNAIELEKARAQSAKARTKFKVNRDSSGAVTDVEAM